MHSLVPRSPRPDPCAPCAPAVSSPITGGAAVSGAVGRVPSAGHGSRGPSLASPGDRRTVPASSAAQSVPLLLLLLLPGERERRPLPVCPTNVGTPLPCGSQPGPVTRPTSRGGRER